MDSVNQDTLLLSMQDVVPMDTRVTQVVSLTICGLMTAYFGIVATSPWVALAPALFILGCIALISLKTIVTIDRPSGTVKCQNFILGIKRTRVFPWTDFNRVIKSDRSFTSTNGKTGARTRTELYYVSLGKTGGKMDILCRNSIAACVAEGENVGQFMGLPVGNS